MNGAVATPFLASLPPLAASESDRVIVLRTLATHADLYRILRLVWEADGHTLSWAALEPQCWFVAPKDLGHRLVALESSGVLLRDGGTRRAVFRVSERLAGVVDEIMAGHRRH
jgi:hypothetical protein